MQEPAAFAETVAKLEYGAGRRLSGPYRAVCLQAFEQNERGFRACVEAALQRAKQNPVGLLVKMVRDGDWNVPEPPPAPAINETTRCTHENCRGLERCQYE
jgi:hypothetical protein